MGKYIKKTPTFGNGLFDGLEPKNTETPVATPTPESTPTHTQEYKPTSTPVKKKIRRDRRMNFLMEPSKAEKLKAYAEKYDVSMNDILDVFVDEILDEKFMDERFLEEND